MESRIYTSEGIILSRKNYGEADRIIKIYSQKYGKVGVIAKGVRKPSSRKRGHLEIFSLINFQSARGDLGVLTEAQNVNQFESVRKSLRKISLAYYFCEVVEKTTRDHEENVELYSILKSFLIRLGNESSLKDLRQEFVTKLLMCLGYWPRGQKLPNPDRELTEVLERELSTVKIGKKLSK